MLRGNKIFDQITRKSKNSLLSISLPSYENNIYIRSNSSDTEVFEAVFIALRFDKIHDHLKPKLIIDAGANIGLVSIFFANKYPNSIIYAIEPESSNFDLLVKNTIGLKNIIPVQAAIWKDNSPLSFENLDAEKWAFRVTEKTESSEVIIRTLTVNDILSMAKKDFIDIFKIDIEGAEKDVFEENFETWIDKVGIFIIELHEGFRKGSQNSFYSAISHLKYHESIKGQNHYIYFK